MTKRYAIYYAPPADHLLWQAGCQWLQRDPASKATSPPTRPHIASPWRYGFHATLKAPLRLAEGRDEAGFLSAVAALASQWPRFKMPALSVQWLAGFLALRPAVPLPRGHALHRLADACVTELDGWRAPATPEELQRRLATPLDDAAREGLMRWGYPHVLDHWRFHMTLTDTLPPHDTALHTQLLAEARSHFADALQRPLPCDALSVFVEPAPGEAFQLIQRCPLA